MSSFLSGLVLGFGLILAIGAQNAFVLRQGLRQQHVLPVVSVCAISDAILIAAGVVGFGVIIERAAWVEPFFRYAGAAFLMLYGIRSALAAWKGVASLDISGQNAGSLLDALLTCLALTWLNPHVYLDTVILLGSIAAQSANRAAFGAGAVAASFAFFFSLGFGARALAPVFAKPVTWRLLDAGIALVMWALAARLMLV